MIDFDAIRADREAGTHSYHWIGNTLMAKEFGETVELFSADWSPLDEFKDEHKRRIARVQEMEAALLAAEELAKEVGRVCQVLADTNGHAPVMLEKHLRAYRKATGADQ